MVFYYRIWCQQIYICIVIYRCYSYSIPRRCFVSGYLNGPRISWPVSFLAHSEVDPLNDSSPFGPARHSLWKTTYVDHLVPAPPVSFHHCYLYMYLCLPLFWIRTLTPVRRWAKNFLAHLSSYCFAVKEEAPPYQIPSDLLGRPFPPGPKRCFVSGYLKGPGTSQPVSSIRLAWPLTSYPGASPELCFICSSDYTDKPGFYQIRLAVLLTLHFFFAR